MPATEVGLQPRSLAGVILEPIIVFSAKNVCGSNYLELFEAGWYEHSDLDVIVVVRRARSGIYKNQNLHISKEL